MGTRNFEALISYLTDEFGESLRWVATFDSDQYTYRVRHIREDLKTELSGMDLDTIVHRSIAVFNRRHVEDVYFHLGDAQSLLVEHEQALAFHLYLDDRRGVVIKLQTGATVSVPELREECIARLAQ